VTLATPPFRKICKGHVRTVPGNVHVKFEVRIFNRFGAIIHSVHLAEIINLIIPQEMRAGRFQSA